MSKKVTKTDIRLANAIGVGFLVLSLAAITVTVSDPVKRQLILSFAATAITPPTTNYQPIPHPPVTAPPSRSPSPSPRLSPSSLPTNRPTPTPGANGAIPLVSTCLGGCNPEDIMLPGQTPGRIGYVYQSGNIAGFYQAPNGLYYPVGQSAGGPTINDLNGLAQTINLQRTATTDPNAYTALVQTNPTVAAQTTATLTSQCQADRPANINCSTTQGIASYILYEHKNAEDLLMHLYQSRPGTYSDLQIMMDLSKLQQYLARNIISQNQFVGAVQQAQSNIQLNNATRVTPTPSGPSVGGHPLTSPTTTREPRATIAPTNSPLGNITGSVGTRSLVTPSPTSGSVGTRTTVPHPTTTVLPTNTGNIGSRNVDLPSTSPRATLAPTPVSFVDYVNNAIRQAGQNLGIIPTPTPRPATMPSTRVGLSPTGQTTTTYVNTDNGLITTTTEIVKDPVTGRVTDTNITQTRITDTRYQQTPTGIVRTDTVTTTDLTTGRIIDTQTTSTQLTNQSQARTPIVATGNAGRTALTPTPTPRVPTIVSEIKNIVNNIFNGSPTPIPTPTPFHNRTPTSPPSLIDLILSGIFGTPTPVPTAGIVGSRDMTGFGSILNQGTVGSLTPRPSPTPNSPPPPSGPVINTDLLSHAIVGGNSGITLPSTYIPPNMITLNNNLQGAKFDLFTPALLAEDALGPVQQWVSWLNQQGYTPLISSAYRSYDTQAAYHSSYGNEAATAGGSCHQTGLCFDVHYLIDNRTGTRYEVCTYPNRPECQVYIEAQKKAAELGIAHPYNWDQPHFMVAVAADPTITPFLVQQQNAISSQPLSADYIDALNNRLQNTLNQATGGPQSNSGSSSPGTASNNINQSILSFAEQKMANCVRGRAGAYNACVGEYYNGQVLTSQQAATLQSSPWEANLNNGDPTKLYWCTELVIDAAQNSGVPIGNNVNNIRPVHAMYNSFQQHTTTYTQNDINVSNVADRLKPGMIAFINTPNVDPLSEFDHAAIIKDVNVVSTIDLNGRPQNIVNVTIVQSNSATVEATFEMDANGKLVYNAGGGTYNMVAFADLTNYVP